MENRLPIVADWSVLRGARPPKPPRGRELGLVLLSILAAAALPWIVSAAISWAIHPRHGRSPPLLQFWTDAKLCPGNVTQQTYRPGTT
jgi:hypothetical protein